MDYLIIRDRDAETLAAELQVTPDVAKQYADFVRRIRQTRLDHDVASFCEETEGQQQ